MTHRLGAVLSAALFNLICALSLGDTIFYLFYRAAALVISFSVLSVFFVYYYIDISQQLDSSKKERGESVSLTVNIRIGGLLPIAPLVLSMDMPEGRGSASLSLSPRKRHSAQLTSELSHVGVFPFRVNSVTISDIFGLIRINKKIKDSELNVISLPRTFDVENLSFPIMDDGKAMANDSGEDITSPEDTRSYREGDPLKRIHWKLTMRFREPIVRRFEVPAPPDTLVLLDISRPNLSGKGEEEELRLRDTLCETALSIAQNQLKQSMPVRIPLYGSRIGEFHQDNMTNIQMLKEELAAVSFNMEEPFEKIIGIELSRMRRVGACAVISTNLNAHIVEAIKNIRKLKVNVRFYYISLEPETEQSIPYISRLQRYMVEVRYVIPS
ncbi:MAG: DUF58 domain-containing protein [Christensenellaceae bacterium]|nr:DUF58 domain-containing protein [Christensenellaceae bacterium]